MNKIFTIFMMLVGVLSIHAERVQLINEASQLNINNVGEGQVANLIDGNSGTALHSKRGELDGDCFIQVTFQEPITLGADEDLVVFTQRCGHAESEGHPTTMRVERSEDGVSWDNVWDDTAESCHVYFLYRGPNTKEYSTRIHTSRPIKALRFTVTANSGRKFDSNGHRYMGMSEFQIFRIGRYDNYSPMLTDRLHLTSDYYRKLTDYGFENTLGILDKRNRNVEINIRNDDITNWCDWESWVNGKWTKDAEYLEKAGIRMPDYSMITAENSGSLGYRPDPGQQRQPTHVTEHVLYAIPGDAVALYPYYSFTSTVAYQVNFAHWYDYESGGHLSTIDESTGKQTNLLDFLIDPVGVHKNNQYGYFAGKSIGMEYPAISTPEEYIEFVKSTNITSGEKKCARLTNDLDFTGYTDVPTICANSWYQGIIDGKGHRIKNLKMKRTGQSHVGLIAKAGNDCLIRNLIIDESCEFYGKDKVAALVAEEVYGNGLKIENVQCYATVTATDGAAAALIASKGDSFNSPTSITDCYVGGAVNGTVAAAVAIWRDDFEREGKPEAPRFRINNTVSTATVNSGTTAGSPFAIVPDVSIGNCYYGENLPSDLNDTEFLNSLGNGWTYGSDGHAVPVVNNPFVVADSKYGKVATFFCPRSPYVPEGELQSLPFRNGESEFVIAADFSQSFSLKHNLDETTKTLIEPVIQFRHIFRIRDGKEFAEEFSGSEEANKEYVRKNMRRVSARAGAAFQIRLDSPIPQKGTTRSKYYYKISNTDYRRVCTMNIEVTDLATGQVRKTLISQDGTMTDENGNAILSGDSPVDPTRFYFSAEFDGEGSRFIEGIQYNICGGGGKYYRMLKCNSPQSGRYRVRITGNDINGAPIKIFGSEAPLVVMEMELTVMPESSASLVDEETLYGDDTYAHAREEVLEKTYGVPRQSLTFDEYAVLENLPDKKDYLDGSGHRYKYKWPMPWNSVTYSFDYNMTRDYNMYCVASHSSKTVWHSEADKFVNPDKSTGLYDRLYYKTTRQGQSVKYGYFYYVNASVDPGVMARLSMESLCMGSTIHVSAWIAEFSGNSEVANISFNFVAVLKDAYGKDRVPLHSFISGYVPRDKLGRWMNVYYSFVPNYAEADLTPDMIDHYELELDNNCTSSAGADYAVDNIRMYVASPLLYAEQREPVCDAKVEDITVTVETPFDVMLQVLGEAEAPAGDNKMTNLYYTFIDKDEFDSRYAEYMASGDPAPGQRAYEESVLRYDYENGGKGDQTYGKACFNLNFASNPTYDEDNLEISSIGSGRTEADGTRLITFNARPSDSRLGTGKEYYVSIYPVLEDIGIPTWNEFDINDPCARTCVFRVRPTSVIKVDGEVRENADNITCCENQSPVVQVDLWGRNEESDEMEPVEKNARLDWYSGDYESFVNERSENGILLSDALILFRSVYADAEDCDVVPSGDLTDEMIGYLKEMTEQIPEGDAGPRLRLSQTSFVFTPTSIPDGEEYCYRYAVAIPISEKRGNILLCTVPTEVRIRVQHTAPSLNHGLRKGIPYPDHMVDVPLRIGLKQLHEVSADVDMVKSHDVKLEVPVRKVIKASDAATGMNRIVNNPYIQLVETNDPWYKDLGTEDADGNDTGTLMCVGEIVDLAAKVNDTESNCFQVVFYNSFRFKEGYYYRMRFMFEENASDILTAEDAMCMGQDVFTVKVVPEYQRWIGGEGNVSRNWNNDANWERVESSDLYLTDARKSELDEYVTDGAANDNRRSYAPLGFSKVMIPSGSVYPHLGKYSYSGNLASDYTNLKNVYWTDNPSDEMSGQATDGIQFDMVAYNASQWYVNCRPWYANTCEQIHFLPESEISGQENLTYEKAWIDVALAPGRWYTLSSPLRTVLAGDFYLPSSNARQETELFSDITFATAVNDRFNPAVYQRGWNKSNATVYEIKDGPERNVAVKADWSNVYNDVTESYGNGTGFSLKTDASRTSNDGEVLFRLPKADKFFEYYSEDGTTVGNRTDVNRGTTGYMLNNVNGEIYSRCGGDSRYFLVGNPFMAHLDMAMFLEANKEKISPKYWILTDGSQQTAVFDPDDPDGFVGSATGYVAPMQGFFVEALDKAPYPEGEEMVLQLSYTAEMACIQPFSNSPLKSSTRAESPDGVGNTVVVSAVRGSRTVSQAFIRLSDRADSEYNENEDVVLFDNTDLDIPVMAYTVGGNVALSVNSTDDADGTEVGLVSTDDGITVLVFNGVECLEDLVLYDTATGLRTALYDGMKYPVEGSVAGRLFITSGLKSIDDVRPALKVNVNDGHVRVETAVGKSLEVNVYTMDGMTVMTESVDAPVMEFDLERGFYILEASDGIKTETRKILI